MEYIFALKSVHRYHPLEMFRIVFVDR